MPKFCNDQFDYDFGFYAMENQLVSVYYDLDGAVTGGCTDCYTIWLCDVEAD